MMKKIKTERSIISLFLVLLLSPALLFGQPLNAPNLGAVSKFALFTSVGAVTCTGTTIITGNIGTNSGALTGFPPGVISQGQTHVQDALTLQAATDVSGAYTYLQNMSCASPLGTTLGNNQTITPGIYCTGAASSLNGNLTFDALGNPDALFVIQIDGAFSTSTFSNVSLVNGASFCNIYWQVNGAFSLGDFSLFRGTIITNGAISLLEGATILGRGLSIVGAITAASVTATMPIPYAINIESNRNYLYTNESATFTTEIKCGCPTNDVVPVVIIPSELTHQSGGAFGGNSVIFPATTFAEGQTITFSFVAMLNNTAIPPVSLFYDGVEGIDSFTASTLAGVMPTFSHDTITPLFESRSWAVGDSIFPSDVALTLNTPIAMPASGNYSLHFNHQFLSDTLDGGVLEFSINGGALWTDAATLFTQNGYNDTLNFITDNNLINRQVFTRNSNGKRESIVDISSFVGQNLLFRFRFATGTGNGAALGLEGWKIDRIWVANTVPCLPLIAQAVKNNIVQIADTMCQELSAQPLGFGFALACPASFKSCDALITYPNATIVNNEGATIITYSHASGTIFPNGITTVLVNASDAGGNTATCSFDVTVNDSMPSINNLPVNVADTIIVCSNVLVTLTAPEADEYLWYKNGIPINYQIAPNNTYVIAGAPGTNVYTVAVVHTGMPCLSVQSAGVTITKVNPVAAITLSGPAAFCANTPTTLNATPGMSNYVWKRSTNTLQSGVSDSYIPQTSGNHNVTVTDSYGCIKTSAWINITINPAPIAKAGLDKNVCMGASTQIGANNVISYTYSWSPSTGLSSTSISNPIVTPLANTTYTLFASNAVTGCMSSDSVNVITLALPPTPTTSSNNVGNTVVIASNTPNATSINWYRNGLGLYSNRLPNSSISVYHSNPTYAYTVKSKGTNGCLSLPSSTINVRLNENQAGESLYVNAYPNPTNDLLNIEILNSDSEDGKIVLYNALGQVVLEKNIILSNKSANEQLDMSHLASGMYSLIFQGGKTQYITKVIKD